MKRVCALVAGAFLAAALPAAAADSPKEDLKFLGIDKCHKDKFDCVWVADGFSFSGKTIHVQKFEKKADAPSHGDMGGLEYGNADVFMQEVFARAVRSPSDVRAMSAGARAPTAALGPFDMSGSTKT